MRKHGWRGQVVTKLASGMRPTENLTPGVRGSQEFVLGAGWAVVVSQQISAILLSRQKLLVQPSLHINVMYQCVRLRLKPDAARPHYVNRLFFRRGLWTRDDDVVRGVGLAVRADGTQRVMVLLAVVLVRTVPWIDTDYTWKVTRAEVVY